MTAQQFRTGTGVLFVEELIFLARGLDHHRAVADLPLAHAVDFVADKEQAADQVTVVVRGGNPGQAPQSLKKPVDGLSAHLGPEGDSVGEVVLPRRELLVIALQPASDPDEDTHDDRSPLHSRRHSLTDRTVDRYQSPPAFHIANRTA
jgi:hypothetical protein